MNAQSYLVQKTANKILENLHAGNYVVLSENALAKQFKVSRTTISAVIIELEKKGVIEGVGRRRRVLRSANDDDFFDISHQVATKVELIEQLFLAKLHSRDIRPGQYFSESQISKETGCNIISVREFLIKFSKYGLIKKNPRGKWLVVELDDKLVDELAACMRLLLLSAVNQLLAIPQKGAVWQQLKSLLDEHEDVQSQVEVRYQEYIRLWLSFLNLLKQTNSNRFSDQFFEMIIVNYRYYYFTNCCDDVVEVTQGLEHNIEVMTNLIAQNTAGAIIAAEALLENLEQRLYSAL